MGALDHFKSPSPASMTCSEKCVFNNNVLNRSLPKIILYLYLSESST